MPAIPGEITSPRLDNRVAKDKRFQDVYSQAQDCTEALGALLAEMCHQHELELTVRSGGGRTISGGRLDPPDIVPGLSRVASQQRVLHHQGRRPNGAGTGRRRSFSSADGSVNSESWTGMPPSQVKSWWDTDAPSASPDVGLAGAETPQAGTPAAAPVVTAQDSDGIEHGLSVRFRHADLEMHSCYDCAWDKKALKHVASDASLPKPINDAMMSVTYKSIWTAINPDSAWMTWLELLGMLCILWDSFAIPWYLALYQKEDRWLFGASWIPRLFWTFDMFVHFGVGYRTHENLVRDLRLTAVHYMRRWFVVDATIVTLDWCFAFLLAEAPSSGILWQLYCGCLAGMVLRMIRQAWRFAAFHEKSRIILRGDFSILTLWIDIALILSALFALNHTICCLWYMIGESRRSDTGSTWMSMLEENSSTWRERTRRYKFATSFHWAITQMTPGSMEVVPESSGERTFTIFVLMLGLIIGPTLTATLTSMMTEKRLRIEEKAKRWMQLQQYLVQESVDRRLVMSINRQVRERLKEKRRIQITDVEDLHLVSKSMQAELTYAVYGKFLLEHLFFHLLDTFDKSAILSICSHTMTPIEQVKGDIVFECGQPGSSMFFVQSGTLQYHPRRLGSEAQALPVKGSHQTVDPGSWFSEVALWAQWLHIGTMHAGSTSELLQICAVDLQRDLRKHPAAFAVTCEYCRAFVKYYQSQAITWSDLSHHIDHDDVISAMTRGAREALSDPILDILKRREDTFSFWKGMFESTMRVKRLREEISAGKCNISITTAGEVVRTVSLVALRLRNALNPTEFLVQIAEHNSESGITVACKLPGSKRREQESATAALHRLLQEELLGLQHQMQEMEDWQTDHSVTFKESPTYGIRTRYLKTTFEAEVELLRPFVTKAACAGNFVVRELSQDERQKNPRRFMSAFGGFGRSALPFVSSSLRQSSGGSHSVGRFPPDHPRKSITSAYTSNSRGERAEMNKWSSASAGAIEVERMVNILQGKEVAVLSPSKRDVDVLVYLWLTEEEMEVLSQDSSAKILRQYVEQLDLTIPPPVSGAIELEQCPDNSDVLESFAAGTSDVYDM